MAGLLMSVATDIFWDTFIAQRVTTSIAPIQQTTNIQSLFDK